MRKQQRMLGIDTDFSNYDESCLVQDSFLSHTSFFDYDAVIFNTQNIVRNYMTNSHKTRENKVCLSQANSIKICEDYQRMQQQIIDYLRSGKNVFILMGHNENRCIIREETNCFGRNELGQYEFDMYSFLPVPVVETYSYGRDMQFCCGSPYKEFFEAITEFTGYSVHYTVQEEPTTPLAKIKGGEKIVSSVIECADGKLIFLPQPNLTTSNDVQRYWEKNTKLFLDSLFELDARLHTPKEVVMPAWVEKISILDEAKHIDTFNQIMNNITELEQKVQEEKEMIRHIQNYKSLITSRGVALEEITKQVLSELGFKLSDTEPGRDDIIAKYKDIDIVAEIKGIKNSAAEKHAAQLEKWASTFLEKNERVPKPILIVNGYCETPLQERTDPVFPEQMIPYSTRRNHALLTTTKLLCLYIEIKTNPSVKEERIRELLETVGVYKRYDDISSYIKFVNETGETND